MSCRACGQASVAAPFRIPMRGYEIEMVTYRHGMILVPNPHEGL